MGKLVLGIIAVSLLQVAFFVYVGKDRADYTTVGEVAMRFEERAPELSRVNDVAQVVVPTTPLPPASKSPEPTRIRTPLSTIRSAKSSGARPSIEARERPVRAHAAPDTTDYVTSRRYPSERIVVPKRPPAAPIPRGYTMVLVDYPLVASSKQTREISEPRKRPLLARAFPALVKKPWKWIKSVASKLD